MARKAVEIVPGAKRVTTYSSGVLVARAGRGAADGATVKSPVKRSSCKSNFQQPVVHGECPPPAARRRSLFGAAP